MPLSPLPATVLRIPLAARAPGPLRRGEGQAGWSGLLLVALVLATAPGRAWTAQAETAAVPFTLTSLDAGRVGVDTLRMLFTQEKHLAMLDEPVISQGRIEISRPLGAVRWEFIGRSLLLFRAGHVRRFDTQGHEESLGDHDPSLMAMAGQMRALLDGDWGPLQSLFRVVPGTSAHPVITFLPASPDLARYITSLTIAFRPDLRAPERIDLVAAGGDTTIYRFAAPEINIPLPAARFAAP